MQLVRTPKPTGDGECPPEVERAHELNDWIQSKVSCRDLADNEIAGFEGDGDDSDDEMSDGAGGAEDADGADDEAPAIPAHRTTQPAPRVRTTRTSATMPARQPSARGSNLLDRITDSLDPQHPKLGSKPTLGSHLDRKSVV